MILSTKIQGVEKGESLLQYSKRWREEKMENSQALEMGLHKTNTKVLLAWLKMILEERRITYPKISSRGSKVKKNKEERENSPLCSKEEPNVGREEREGNNAQKVE